MLEETYKPPVTPLDPPLDTEDLKEQEDLSSETESTEAVQIEIPSEEIETVSGDAAVVTKRSILKDKKKIITILSYVFPIALFFLAVFIVAYYIIVPAKTEFHSDCTDTIFWAKATFDSGKMINPDFSYACLLPFGGNLLMLIFMPFFGLSMTTHTLGMLLFFVLLTAAFCWMLHEMRWGVRGICYTTFVFLMVLCSSKKLREIFWGHVIYYSLGILFLFVGLALLFHMQNLKAVRPQNKKLRIYEVITLVILLDFFMFCCTDQITAITIFALPMMAAIFVERLLDQKTKLISKRNGETLLLLVMLGAILVVGMKIGQAWAGDTVAGYADAYSKFKAQDEWVDNAHKFPLAWMTLLGLEDIPGETLMSGKSIVNLIRIMVSLLLIVLPIIASCCYPKYKGTSGRQIRILIWAHWVVTALIMVGYICGALSAANWRLSPIICTSTVVSLVFLHWAIAKRTTMQRFSLVLCIPLAAFSVLSAWNVKEIDTNYKETDLYQLVDLLEEKDLTYGYATFWRSQAMTVISGDTVRVCCVSVDEYGVSARNYQIDKTWFEGDSEQENYFLLLDTGEYQTLVDNNAEILTRATSDEILTTAGGTSYKLLVFSYNIF